MFSVPLLFSPVPSVIVSTAMTTEQIITRAVNTARPGEPVDFQRYRLVFTNGTCKRHLASAFSCFFCQLPPVGLIVDQPMTSSDNPYQVYGLWCRKGEIDRVKFIIKDKLAGTPGAMRPKPAPLMKQSGPAVV